jgi:hypothetical protein
MSKNRMIEDTMSKDSMSKQSDAAGCAGRASRSPVHYVTIKKIGRATDLKLIQEFKLRSGARGYNNFRLIRRLRITQK